MSEKKRDAGYRAALTGAKGTVRLLIYVCVILVIILAAKTSYQFGHDVFAEEPVASRGKGKEVTVQVRSGMEAKELGELLKDNGLIDESLLVRSPVPPVRLLRRHQGRFLRAEHRTDRR